MHQNLYIYNNYEFTKMIMSNLNTIAKFAINSIGEISFPLPFTANLKMLERLTRSYEKQRFGIESVQINKKIYKIEEEIILNKDFCELRYFKKDSTIKLPNLLIVAPMAGHHATLLRDTVQSLLPYYEIYITDWIDASKVPLSSGNFDLDDYIDYIIEFIELLGPNLNVMAVCQPTVPVLCAASYMAEFNNPKRPKSLMLIGGPIDTRQNPTQVNKYAMNTNLNWLEQNLISIVPFTQKGFMRPVYPGFIQLFSFMSMNMERHIESHLNLYNDMLKGETISIEKQSSFYDEYFTVMDLPAEFFLQTIEKVFQKHELAKGVFHYREHKIKPTKITDIAILGIEGEKDDITGIGQTREALNLCTNLPEMKKSYHLQLGAGHYGVFSGSKFRTQIVPIINKFIEKNLD